jgi:hypothetical protein
MSVRHRVRTLTCTAVLVTATVWSLGGPAAAQESKSPVRRVRSGDPSIAALIERAITDSPTFERLVAAVEASNGIVHVQSGRCSGGVVACLPIWMTSSGGNRFMRIVVDLKRIDSDGRLLGAIGHELQHAIEVLSDRFVTNSTKMYFFYRRYAPTDRDRFETLDAAYAGLAVERELRAWRGEGSPCSVAPKSRDPDSNKIQGAVRFSRVRQAQDRIRLSRCLGGSVCRDQWGDDESPD